MPQASPFTPQTIQEFLHKVLVEFFFGGGMFQGYTGENSYKILRMFKQQQVASCWQEHVVQERDHLTHPTS